MQQEATQKKPLYKVLHKTTGGQEKVSFVRIATGEQAADFVQRRRGPTGITSCDLASFEEQALINAGFTISDRLPEVCPGQTGKWLITSLGLGLREGFPIVGDELGDLVRTGFKLAVKSGVTSGEFEFYKDLKVSLCRTQGQHYVLIKRQSVDLSVRLDGDRSPGAAMLESADELRRKAQKLVDRADLITAAQRLL